MVRDSLTLAQLLERFLRSSKRVILVEVFGMARCYVVLVLALAIIQASTATRDVPKPNGNGLNDQKNFIAYGGVGGALGGIGGGVGAIGGVAGGLGGATGLGGVGGLGGAIGGIGGLGGLGGGGLGGGSGDCGGCGLLHP